MGCHKFDNFIIEDWLVYACKVLFLASVTHTKFSLPHSILLARVVTINQIQNTSIRSLFKFLVKKVCINGCRIHFKYRPKVYCILMVKVCFFYIEIKETAFHFWVCSEETVLNFSSTNELTTIWFYIFLMSF